MHCSGNPGFGTGEDSVLLRDEDSVYGLKQFPPISSFNTLEEVSQPLNHPGCYHDP